MDKSKLLLAPIALILILIIIISIFFLFFYMKKAQYNSNKQTTSINNNKNDEQVRITQNSSNEIQKNINIDNNKADNNKLEENKSYDDNTLSEIQDLSKSQNIENQNDQNQSWSLQSMKKSVVSTMSRIFSMLNNGMENLGIVTVHGCVAYRGVWRKHESREIYKKEYSKETLDIVINDKLRFFKDWKDYAESIFKNNKITKEEKEICERTIKEKQELIEDENKKQEPDRIRIDNANKMIKTFSKKLNETNKNLKIQDKIGFEAALNDLLKLHKEYRELQDVRMENFGEEKTLNKEESNILNFVEDIIEEIKKRSTSSKNSQSNLIEPKNLIAILDEKLNIIKIENKNSRSSEALLTLSNVRIESKEDSRNLSIPLIINDDNSEYQDGVGVDLGDVAIFINIPANVQYANSSDLNKKQISE